MDAFSYRPALCFWVSHPPSRSGFWAPTSASLESAAMGVVTNPLMVAAAAVGVEDNDEGQNPPLTENGGLRSSVPAAGSPAAPSTFKVPPVLEPPAATVDEVIRKVPRLDWANVVIA